MILDRGIADIYEVTNTATAGEQSNKAPVLVYSSWFGELEYVSTPRQDIGQQFVGSVDRKIRVIDDPTIKKGVTVQIFDPLTDDTESYTILKAWHGKDKESGERVADVYLQRTVFSDG